MFLEDRTFYFKELKTNEFWFRSIFPFATSKCLAIISRNITPSIPDMRIIYPNEIIFLNLMQYLFKSPKINLPIFRINFTFFITQFFFIKFSII